MPLMEPEHHSMPSQVQDPLPSLPIEPENQPSLDAAIDPAMSNQLPNNK